jgi:hypothetical protein
MELEVDHSLPSFDEVKKEYRHISPPPVCLRVVALGTLPVLLYAQKVAVEIDRGLARGYYGSPSYI